MNYGASQTWSNEYKKILGPLFVVGLSLYTGPTSMVFYHPWWARLEFHLFLFLLSMELSFEKNWIEKQESQFKHVLESAPFGIDQYLI